MPSPTACEQAPIMNGDSAPIPDGDLTAMVDLAKTWAKADPSELGQAVLAELNCSAAKTDGAEEADLNDARGLVSSKALHNIGVLRNDQQPGKHETGRDFRSSSSFGRSMAILGLVAIAFSAAACKGVASPAGGRDGNTGGIRFSSNPKHIPQGFTACEYPGNEIDCSVGPKPADSPTLSSVSPTSISIEHGPTLTLDTASHTVDFYNDRRQYAVHVWDSVGKHGVTTYVVSVQDRG